MSAVIDCHLANIINNDLSLNKYSKHAKAATVRSIFKKDDRTKIKNYRHVSLLKYCFENIRTISALKSYKLRRHISFKIYFGIWQVL